MKNIKSLDYNSFVGLEQVDMMFYKGSSLRHPETDIFHMCWDENPKYYTEIPTDRTYMMMDGEAKVRSGQLNPFLSFLSFSLIFFAQHADAEGTGSQWQRFKLFSYQLKEQKLNKIGPSPDGYHIENRSIQKACINEVWLRITII